MSMNYKFTGLLLMILFLPALLSTSWAGDADRVGTASGVQVQIPVGGRDLAMSGANLAKTSGLEALYWNPAGLSSSLYQGSAMFSTMNTIADIRVNYFAITGYIEKIGFLALDMKATNCGDIPYTTNIDYDGQSGRDFSPTFVTAGLTFSRKITDIIQFGLKTKLIYESVPRASASAVAFDIGIQYHNLGNVDNLSLGVAMKNIGTDMTYDGSAFFTEVAGDQGKGENFVSRPVQTSALPNSVEFGLTYCWDMLETHDFLVAGLFQNNNYQHDAVKFGGEYTYMETMSLRAGYEMLTGGDTEEYDYSFTMGAGLKYKLLNSLVSFDYAFRASQYFDGNHVFSFRIGF